KGLERFRHEQAKEIEHLRHEINSLFSRVSKIHEREFEVLPAAWQKLHESYGRAQGRIKIRLDGKKLKGGYALTRMSARPARWRHRIPDSHRWDRGAIELNDSFNSNFSFSAPDIDF